MPPYLPCCDIACLSSIPTPTATPTPTPSACDPLINNCPLGTTCGCCCGAWECLHGTEICCEIACMFPTPVSTATPTPTEPCSGSPCGGTCVICPPCTPGTICPLAPCELGHCELSAAGSCACAPGLAATPTATPTLLPGTCIGDCNGDGAVTINEIILMLNITLGNVSSAACPAVHGWCPEGCTVNDLIAAVNNALYGCLVGPPPTPTPQCSEVPCGGSCTIAPPCTPGPNTACPNSVMLGVCGLNPLSGCQCEPVEPVTMSSST